MQKNTKKRKGKKENKRHLTRCYIYSWQSYIWPRKPTGQCCRTISNKYTLKQQINLRSMHLNSRCSWVAVFLCSLALAV